MLRIATGVPNNAIFVRADGNVGLGDGNPSKRLDVDGNIASTGTVNGRDVAADGAALDVRVADFNNPHRVTAEQTGAISQVALDAHTGDFNNPHLVTAAQTGADVVGAAAATVATHDHTHLTPGTPLSIDQGGTCTSDAATARANLGIEDDPTRTGILPAGFFTGSPATAEVTFSAPYPAGTS